MRRLIQPALIVGGVVLLGTGLVTITAGQGDLGLGIEIIGVLFVITAIARGYSVPLITGQQDEIEVLRRLREDYHQVACEISRTTGHIGTLASQRTRDLAILEVAIEMSEMN